MNNISHTSLSEENDHAWKGLHKALTEVGYDYEGWDYRKTGDIKTQVDLVVAAVSSALPQDAKVKILTQLFKIAATESKDNFDRLILKKTDKNAERAERRYSPALEVLAYGFENYTLDPLYVQQHKDAMRRFVQSLVGDKKKAELDKKWSQLQSADPKDREVFLSGEMFPYLIGAMDSQFDVMGISSSQTHKTLLVEELAKDDAKSGGCYDGDKHTIRVTYKKSDDLYSICGYALHENNHCNEDLLGEACLKGALPEDSPLRDQAYAFSRFYERSVKLMGHDVSLYLGFMNMTKQEDLAYRSHPTERAARWTQYLFESNELLGPKSASEAMKEPWGQAYGPEIELIKPHGISDRRRHAGYEPG